MDNGFSFLFFPLAFAFIDVMNDGYTSLFTILACSVVASLLIAYLVANLNTRHHALAGSLTLVVVAYVHSCLWCSSGVTMMLTYMFAGSDSPDHDIYTPFGNSYHTNLVAMAQISQPLFECRGSQTTKLPVSCKAYVDSTRDQTLSLSFVIHFL